MAHCFPLRSTLVCPATELAHTFCLRMLGASTLNERPYRSRHMLQHACTGGNPTPKENGRAQCKKSKRNAQDSVEGDGSSASCSASMPHAKMTCTCWQGARLLWGALPSSTQTNSSFSLQPQN